MKVLSLLTFVCCLAAANPVQAFQKASTESKNSSSSVLTIGSDAPSLKISNWFSKGKFDEVTDFKPGNVYVIEFWGTWCPPCIASMPHISELQSEYADKGVQIISVSDEDPEKVEKFLEGKVKGTQKTYGELTSNYCVTADPDRSVRKSYMSASGETKVPVAFIVGKTGKIEWIGQPVDIDKPLAQVVAGKWDRDAAKAKHEGGDIVIAAGKVDETMELIEKSIIRNDMDLAIKQLDEAIALNTGKDKDFLNMKKYQIMEKAGHGRIRRAVCKACRGGHHR